MPKENPSASSGPNLINSRESFCTVRDAQGINCTTNKAVVADQKESKQADILTSYNLINIKKINLEHLLKTIKMVQNVLNRQIYPAD